jgi:hypothetical protein
MRLFLPVVTLVTLFGCNGNGHVEQKMFVARPGDDVVNCACNLTFGNEHCSGGTCYEHFNVQLCLPVALQRPMMSTPPAPGSPDGGVDDYSHAIDEYCRQTVTTTVYHLITVFNGSWCEYKSPFAPMGGIGSSVECFAQPLNDSKPSATARDDGTCMTPCQKVECDYNSNCGKNVQDSWGNINLDNCKCSEISWRQCPGDSPSDLPTPPFCRPPSNVSLQ